MRRSTNNNSTVVGSTSNGTTGVTPANPADGSRIPKTLQAVFLASNRGNEVNKPPPKQVAFRTFFRSFLGKKNKEVKESTKEKNNKKSKDEIKVENSYQKKSKSSKNESMRPPKPEKKIENPQAFLDHIMKTRGYCTKRYNTLRTAYHNKPTALQKASYDLHLIGLVKGGDAVNLDDVLKAGISPNPCNTYGESLVHMVCRRGDQKLLQVMIQNGCDIQVADDYGRTPLHDACWAAEPAFDTVELLLERDLTLLQMTDCRGFLPLSYVRKDHWPAWIEFFDRKKNVYFPNLLSSSNNDDDDSKSIISTVSTVSEFVDQSPDSRPLPDPKNALPLDLANMVASGQLKPEEAIALRNKRLAKPSKVPRSIEEGKELENDDDDDDDDDDDSDDDDSDDDSDYDSDDSDYDDDDDDLTDSEMQELMGVLSIQLRGAESSGTGTATVTEAK